MSDITSVWTDEDWLYLAVVLDLFSRKVVGWAMAARMTAALVCDALTMALWRRKRPAGVIVHFGPGQPVLFRRPPSLAGPAQAGVQHEQEGRWL